MLHFIDYKGTLIATVKGLMEIGWVEGASIPEEKGEKTDNIWRWLSTELKSDYIQFVSDAHYSANWDDTLRANMAEEIITRLNQKKDIFLVEMLLMGHFISALGSIFRRFSTFIFFPD